MAIEYRWAEGRSERFVEIATEFVQLKVDIIVASTTLAVIAAKQATAIIPIVIATTNDPVGTVLSPVWREQDAETVTTLFSPQMSNFIGTAWAQSDLKSSKQLRGGVNIDFAQFTRTRSEKMAKRRQQNRRRVQAAQARPASHAAKAGADLFESTVGAVEQLWRSGLDMASHFADRSSRQVSRSVGLTDETARQATEQSSRNIDAIVQSSRAYADALQSVSRELSSFCRERLDRNIERMNALMRSRTPQELIAAQSDLLRDNLEGILQSGRRVAEASVGVTDETTHRLTELMGKQRRAA